MVNSKKKKKKKKRKKEIDTALVFQFILLQKYVVGRSCR